MTFSLDALLLLCALMVLVWSTARDVYIRLRWLMNEDTYEFKQTRHFFTASREGEAKVKAFYATLDRLKSRRNESDAFNVHEHVAFAPWALKQLLKQLYGLNSMWAALGEDRQDVREWAHLLTTTFQEYYCTLLTSWQLCDKKERQAVQATQLLHELIKYSKVLQHYDELHMDGQFIAMLLEDILHWSAREGLLPAFLVFAHLMPDMVCDECYPVLTNDTDMYQQFVTYESVATYSRFKPLLQQYQEYIIL